MKMKMELGSILLFILSIFNIVRELEGRKIDQQKLFENAHKPANRTPVVLVPGDGASRIYALVEDHGICPVYYTWFHIWLNAAYIATPLEFCLGRFFSLRYNATTRRTYDPPGVQTKILYWGSTKAIEKLDILNYSASRYFADLVESLVKLGYQRDVDIRGAPFDFRRAPNENLDFVPKLKALIEDTYRKNGKKKVMVLAHSLGNLYVLFFLRRMSSAWKKEYVRGYIAVSPPIAGAVKPLKLITSGDTLSKLVPYVIYMREIERSMSSTPLMFPSPYYWRSDEILVSRPSRNYTVKDYHQLILDLNQTNIWEMYKDVSNLIDPHWIPDVDELYCVHGAGLRTPDTYVWSKDSDFPDERPTYIYGDGDGTVNLRSLKVCHGWPDVQVTVFNGSAHETILKEPRFINLMSKILEQH